MNLKYKKKKKKNRQQGLFYRKLRFSLELPATLDFIPVDSSESLRA
jgi:hypothetical protein